MGYQGTLKQGKRGGRDRGNRGRSQIAPPGAVIWVPTQGVSVVADVQTISRTATGGTFTIISGGDVTGNLDFDALKSEVETAVETLDEVTACTVTGSDTTGPWIITNNDAGGAPGETFTLGVGSLTGGTATLVHTTTGVANVFEVVSFWVDGDTGTFTLSYGGQTTATIVYSANAALIDTRLTALSTIADVAVTGAGTEVSPFVVTFADPAGAATAITADLTLLYKTVAAAARVS